MLKQYKIISGLYGILEGAKMEGAYFDLEEVMLDPDPTNTKVESTYTYTITKDGVTTVEIDTHVTGLFAINTWTRLMEDAGFSVELRPLPPNEGGYGSWLFIGVLGDSGKAPTASSPPGTCWS